MDCEWDPAKAATNLAKHGVQFVDAVSAMEDERALTIRDLDSEDEERWITIGLDSQGRLLVVVYTWRSEKVRLISARLATSNETRQYEEDHEG